MTALFLIGFLIAGLVNFVFSIMILRALNVAGVRVGFYEMRWQVHKHLKTYKKISLAESGRVGLPFYGYWGSLGCLVMFGGLFMVSLLG